MKHSHDQNAPTPDAMNRYRLAPESPGLEQRVMRAAQEAWRETVESEDIPWTWPTFKFATSLAFVVVLITFVNHLASRQSAGRWQTVSDDGASYRSDPMYGYEMGLSGHPAINAELHNRKAVQNLLLYMKQLREMDKIALAQK